MFSTVVCFEIITTGRIKSPFFCLQRSDEAAADARTSGSISPADFFSHTPKENSTFQIPVSCGKNHSLMNTTRITFISLLFGFTVIKAVSVGHLIYNANHFCRHWRFDKPGAAGWQLWGSRGFVSQWWSLCWGHFAIHQRWRGSSQEDTAEIPKQAKKQHINGKIVMQVYLSKLEYYWQVK